MDLLTFALIAVVGAVVTALGPAVTTERRAIVIEPAVAGDAAKA